MQDLYYTTPYDFFLAAFVKKYNLQCTNKNVHFSIDYGFLFLNPHQSHIKF